MTAPAFEPCTARPRSARTRRPGYVDDAGRSRRLDAARVAATELPGDAGLLARMRRAHTRRRLRPGPAHRRAGRRPAASAWASTSAPTAVTARPGGGAAGALLRDVFAAAAGGRPLAASCWPTATSASAATRTGCCAGAPACSAPGGHVLAELRSAGHTVAGPVTCGYARMTPRTAPPLRWAYVGADDIAAVAARPRCVARLDLDGGGPMVRDPDPR